MAAGSGEAYAALATRLEQEIRARCSEAARDGDAVDLIADFACRFHERMPQDELVGRELADLVGNSLGWWRFIAERAGNVFRVEVVSPTAEPDGWSSPHTIVRVLHGDDRFLAASLRNALNRRGVDVHGVHSCSLEIARDAQGRLVGIGDRRALGVAPTRVRREALLQLEINHHASQGERVAIREALEGVLRDVDLAVGDFQPMRDRVAVAIEQLRKHPPSALPESEVDEARAFLDWLLDDHFTFLGLTEMVFFDGERGRAISEVEGSQLGLQKKRRRQRPIEHLCDLRPELATALLEPHLLGFAKSGRRCTVHRNAHADYVTLKRFDEDGQVVGELRFMGLYTSKVYNLSPWRIPVVRQKLREAMDQARREHGGFHGRELEHVLEGFPREELFQSTAAELYRTALGIVRIQERKQVRLFTRRDPFGRFVTCLVFFPRDSYDTALRKRAEVVLREAFGASECEFTTHFSESVLARTCFVLKLDPERAQPVDVRAVEARLVEAARSWEHGLCEALVRDFDGALGNDLARAYGEAFPPGYKDDFGPDVAIEDIRAISRLGARDEIAMRLQRAPKGDSACGLRFRLFLLDEPVVLSDAIPSFENLGLRVTEQHPYAIARRDGRTIWIHDFHLDYTVADSIDLTLVEENFLEAFRAIWTGKAESDRFNRLILGTRLCWREVTILRAYARYMKQLGLVFGQRYIANTLAKHLSIAGDLVALFHSRFDPDAASREHEVEIEDRIVRALDSVESLDEDRIIRQFLGLLRGTLRTNYYQRDEDGGPKPWLALKLDPKSIPNVPQPRPMFEIFVHSPRFEGVHLRAGRVARGGLRWSDRLEDYRTEILGLMKAQQVKNAVIVPVGAKGGFVARRLPRKGSSQAIQAEGIRCYRSFIRGLLDVTDNLVGGEVVPPPRVVCRDGNDPYLVVAADKGTASFSDIANEIAQERGFWLGDAFASGGSVGYDHKKMGITARGAWISVQQHFHERGLDVQSDDFSVVGIGDMSGDVFGNGMLLSRHIRLLAAFDHLHVFVDPNPEAESSWHERRRLSLLPGSRWSDYDPALISEGGGVFPRSAKAIRISPAMRERFAIEADELMPNELISALLRAPVDLIWNGGIGTYVKARGESHADVGDKANDSLRVDAEDLRCGVIGEGGNLGLTQLARVAFASRGGALNTDFVDNAGGVDCSDHEVNIKILLNELISEGLMSDPERRALLEEMTGEVSELVLQNSASQAQAISIAEAQAGRRMVEYRRYIQHLESTGKLDRKLEFIPEDEALVERMAQGGALTRPELAILISYAKTMLKESLATSVAADDPRLAEIVQTAFPPRLRAIAGDRIQSHRLRREILATQLANDLVDRMDFTFIHRMQESTGCDVGEIARAYYAAREIFGLEQAWRALAALGPGLASEQRRALISDLRRMMRHATRWLLRNRRGALDVGREIALNQPTVRALLQLLPTLLQSEAGEAWRRRSQRILAAGGSEEAASLLASAPLLHLALALGEVAETTGARVARVLETYLVLGETLELAWLKDEIVGLVVANHWQGLARESALDDLEWQQRALSVSALQGLRDDEPISAGLERWRARYASFAARWSATLTDLHGSGAVDFAMCSVALRELLDWAQASGHGVGGG